MLSAMNGDALTKDANVLAVQTSFHEAKTYLAELEQKCDLLLSTKKEWISARQPKDGYFRQLSNNARNSVSNTEKAVTDA